MSETEAGEPLGGRRSRSRIDFPAPAREGSPKKEVNDFAFKIATVNGTGSASANGLLMKSIFRMGIPVSGKNLFPSNIQGLPTWYEIRANREGHTARKAEFDLIVAMNPATYVQDVAEVRPGGWILHDSSWPLPAQAIREDVTYLGAPLARLCNERFDGARARILLKNIAYSGILAALLDMDMEVVEGLLQETYGRKKALLDANFEAVRLGYDYAKEHFDCPLPGHLERMDALTGQVLMDGNTAAALGCVYAGATVAAWYPITPSTSLVDSFQAFCNRFRKDPESGRNRVAVIQAEDELAAAGMVIGASWVGGRSFTATSGPGISLMGEFIGLAYYAEIPAVFFDVQRTGPSTGMPTRTQQGDLMAVAYASHGDTKHIALFPAHPGECFEMAVQAFDLAERFQTPVFVVSDLDIGMNDWVIPALEWDDAYRPDRGKVLGARELEELEKFHRYLDVDGDGIPARTLPGVHPKGAFFTRGSGHDRYGRYTEDPDAYADVMERLARKVDGSVSTLPAPEVLEPSSALETSAAPEEVDTRVGIITVGSCRSAVLEARDRLQDRGVAVDVLRIRAFPFAPEVKKFLDSHDPLFVVEQNRDRQLLGLLALETGISRDRMIPVGSWGGMPLSARNLLRGLREGGLEAEATEPEESPSSEPGIRRRRRA